MPNNPQNPTLPMNPIPDRLPTQEELEFKRDNLPFSPGVYIFRNKAGDIIYVGKSKSLRKRVQSYWKDRNTQEDPHYANKIMRLRQNIADIEVFELENEKEALILENELIKTHQPRFNVDLKDSKNYPWVQITNEKFPRIRILRGPERFGTEHTYIGPFVERYELKKMLRFIRKIFPFCSCKRSQTRAKRTRPCIFYQIKLCSAPCVGKIDEKAYRDNITHIEQLLRGDIVPVQNMMKEKMEQASENLKFEEAAKWRDRLKALEIFTVNQSILSFDFGHNQEKNIDGETIKETRNEEENKTGYENLSEKPKKELKTGLAFAEKPKWTNFDIAASHFSKNYAGFIILHVRNGRLLNKTPFLFDLTDKITSQEKFYQDLVKQYYMRPETPIPAEIVLERSLLAEEQIALMDYIHDNRDAKKFIRFRQPNETDKTAGLMRIAQKNIALLIRQKEEYNEHLREQGITEVEDSQLSRGLRELQEILGLDGIPSLIEGFDMSHTQGTDYVGSKVCLKDGLPYKAQYRRYKIKDPTIKASDDVKAMHEVMERRYSRAIREKEILPDLIVVDGGAGQLNMAHSLLNKLELGDIPHIGLSKPPGRSEIYLQPKIVFPDGRDSIELPKGSPALRIIQLLRDESHKFAITYHRKLRRKRQTKSELDSIPGVGPARKKKLLQFFGSVAQLKKAGEAEIADLVGPTLAKAIVEYLEKKVKSETPRKKKIVIKKRQ